jgi:hypothetical protein
VAQGVGQVQTQVPKKKKKETLHKYKHVLSKFCLKTVFSSEQRPLKLQSYVLICSKM